MLLGLSVLGACDRSENIEEPCILLKMPPALYQDQQRWSDFVTKIDVLELSIQKADEVLWAQSFKPGNWEQLPMKQFPVLDPAETNIQFVAKVWAKKTDGTLWGVPVLSGSSELVQKDKSDYLVPNPVFLTLQIPLIDLDQ
ncbi:MAG: hypothetical protein EB078_02070 [Proteobacteria bacterium]|nr:hypothetical protein [Pseudomonadota bacterium]NDC23550.1 hypothetical protein [Pseudomonadota bacterium]NDD03668.1 hypothetical protein [Pseudomonadota bacterium]